MKPKIFATLIVAAITAAQVGCIGGNPTAPRATEPLLVSVQTRPATPGEPVPAVYASSVLGNLVIRVTRPVMCALAVSAAVSRAPHRIDIVSHVSPSPATLCAGDLSSMVVDYTGSVGSLAQGPYLVRVFEGEGDGTPRFIGSATVNLSAFICPNCQTID